MSLQSLKTAHPSDKDINNIPNQSFASNNGFDRKTLSVLVVKSQLPRPTEREKQTAEQRRKKSALVLQILNIGFDPNGPTEMYVDFIVKNPGSPTTVNEWKLSVYDSTGMLSTGLMPRFIQTNFMRTNAFGAPENDNLTQHPLEQGGERRGRLGFTFLRMVADDLFGAKGLRFRITADDVSKSQVEANFTRN